MDPVGGEGSWANKAIAIFDTGGRVRPEMRILFEYEDPTEICSAWILLNRKEQRIQPLSSRQPDVISVHPINPVYGLPDHWKWGE